MKLHSLLLDLRKAEANRLALPPYVIFQEISLEEMATHFPLTPDELLRISGVGSGKAKKYGKPFLALIRQYVEEEGIKRADDLLVRSTQSRGNSKVQIIQRIDRQVDLEDLAQELSLSYAELIGELEAIVAAGTKVNLDYMLEDMLGEDGIEELFDFFRESEDGGTEAVVAEFGDVYTEEELRLVRIKFLSEFAN